MSDSETDQVAPTQGSSSLTETLEEFRQMGFPADFSAREGGILVCAECHQTFEATPDAVSGERRLEGASDPDDMQLVVALICPVCGAHGTAVAHYGPMSDAASQDLVTALSAGGR